MKKSILFILISIYIFTLGCSVSNSDSILNVIGLDKFCQDYEITIFYGLSATGEKIMLTKEFCNEFEDLLSEMKCHSIKELDSHDFEVGSYIVFSFYKNQELITYLTWYNPDSTKLIMHTSNPSTKYFALEINSNDRNKLRNFVDRVYKELH